tara:strand:+ start:2853 stop:3314 length:462 start_codon:yes stop_codon:yes gene_type:complete
MKILHCIHVLTTTRLSQNETKTETRIYFRTFPVGDLPLLFLHAPAGAKVTINGKDRSNTTGECETGRIQWIGIMDSSLVSVNALQFYVNTGTRLFMAFYGYVFQKIAFGTILQSMAVYNLILHLLTRAIYFFPDLVQPTTTTVTGRLSRLLLD